MEARRTYKLFIGGLYPRGESGGTRPVIDGKGRVIAQVTAASAKDARDAAEAAAAARATWESLGARGRAAALGSIARALEERRGELEAEIARSESVSGRRAAAHVQMAIDRWNDAASLASILPEALGSVVPVEGGRLCRTAGQPLGAVAIVTAPEASLLVVIGQLAPVLAAGNTAVLLAPEQRPLPTLVLAQAIAASQLPSGTVNVLTGAPVDVCPELVTAAEIGGVDLSGLADDGLATALAFAAAADPTRVVLRPVREAEGTPESVLSRMRALTRPASVWSIG